MMHEIEWRSGLSRYDGGADDNFEEEIWSLKLLEVGGFMAFSRLPRERFQLLSDPEVEYASARPHSVRKRETGRRALSILLENYSMAGYMLIPWILIRKYRKRNTALGRSRSCFGPDIIVSLRHSENLFDIYLCSDTKEEKTFWGRRNYVHYYTHIELGPHQFVNGLFKSEYKGYKLTAKELEIRYGANAIFFDPRKAPVDQTVNLIFGLLSS
jgi:hypothetical protein